MLVCLPGRFIVLSKRSLAGTVHFLILFLYWRGCVFGFLILRHLTVMGFSQSSPPEQLFSATSATMLLAVSKLGSTISLLVVCLPRSEASKHFSFSKVLHAYVPSRDY